MRPYPDTSLSDRSNAPMPADPAAQQPWLIAGQLLFAPFAPRDTGLTVRETEAIEASYPRSLGLRAISASSSSARWTKRAAAGSPLIALARRRARAA
jgi:hypothetical protein